MPNEDIQSDPLRKHPLAPDAARRMGSASTPAKRAAARENGKLGGWAKGRPRSEETRRRISATKTRQMLERLLRPDSHSDDAR